MRKRTKPDTAILAKLPIEIVDREGNVVNTAEITDPREAYCARWNVLAAGETIARPAQAGRTKRKGVAHA